MAKTLDSLIDSRNIRKTLISKWECIPGSVWKVDWSCSSKDISKSYGDQQVDNALKNGNAFALSGTGARHGALSRFPQDLCRFLTKFYSEENEIVLDPFAGHNSRMESVFLTNRHYIGFDICAEYMQFNRQRATELKEKYAMSLLPIETSITLHENDSRNISNYVTAESVDFCITSPPFWNIEYYGPEKEQLGKLSYDNFIETIGEIVKSCADALKPNKYIAWEVNDFRANGKFYPYHRDTIENFEKAGLLMHDILIIDYGAAFLKSFLSDVDYLKIMPKQHAYMIIGKKPGQKENTRIGHREELIEESKNKPIAIDEQTSFL